MNIDGLTVSALAAELNASLRGSRVQGIFQPQPTLITLELWAGEEKRLLLEIGEQPRVHLTTQKFAHPQRPPAFCMLLRKYLRNGIVVGVSQPGLERILDLSIRHGEEYILRTELLGKQTNIVLLRNGTIVGALKSTVGRRSFRPGETYHAPPAHEKLDPRTMTPEGFFARLSVLSAPFPEGKGELPSPYRGGAGGEVRQALLQIIDGIGPRLAQEIALRAELDPAQPVASLTTEHRAALWNATRQLWESIGQHPSPSLYFDGDRPVDVSPVPLQLYAHLRCESFPTLSQALDAYVHLAPQSLTFAHERHRLQEIVRGYCAKVRHALERVAQDLERARDYEQFRHEGELLLAHLAELRKGLDKIELEDFLDGTSKTITLDPALDPVENAQQKFERYKKLKRAQEKLAARADELRQELEYLESVEHSLEQAESDADLVEIREELGAGGEVRQALLQIIDGIGPRLAQEIALRAELDPAQPVASLTTEHRAALWSATRQLWESISQHPSPSLYFDGDRPVDISPVPLQLYAHLRCESFPTLSQALDAYVHLAPQSLTFAHERHRLQEIVRGYCAKVRHALERVAQDLERARDYEQFRHEGELLLAHLAELRHELEYLESIENYLEQAESDADLSQIRAELGAGGYLPRAPQSREPAHALGPREFVIRGYRVWVGRSSKQNDELVRSAAREDYWLHARDRPGAHVIIRNPTQREIPRDVLEQAAQLAAYYSKGRDAKKVPVSYTRVKYLRKGGRPGLVLMTQEEGTLIVAPKGDL